MLLLLWSVPYRFYAFPLDSPVPHPEDECSDIRWENYCDSVDKDKEAEDTEEEKPEPDENVDLLVDNVQRENAQRVVLLDVAWRPEFVEGALGHSGEDVNHRIDSILLILIGKWHNFNAISEKRPIEKAIQ